MSSPRLLHSPSDRVAFGRARADIAAHAGVFGAVVSRAVGADHPVASAVFAQIAAEWGARAHPGALASVELESLLFRLGREHVPGGSPPARTDDGERVLHVLTEAYETGGHTRVVERWVERDTARGSTIVLTDQTVPVPVSLRATGAELVSSLGGGSLFSRARILRALALEHDLVVLHAHHHDVLPCLALADPDGRPPTILFNHASHCFWLGVAVADVVANLWEPDDRNTRERRGVPADRSLILPIPTNPRVLPSREHAREQLALDPETPVFLAIGTGHKVQPVIDPPFTEVIETVLAAVPNARLLLVGPSPEAAWSAIAERTGGRLHVLGSVADISPHLAAADVLLDTWPASGATTLVDAAAAGLPVLSLGEGDPDHAVFRPPLGTLGGAVVHAPCLDELGRAAADLAADAAARRRIGALGRASVDDRHASGWTTHLQTVVGAAREHHGSARPPATLKPVPVTDWECVMYMLLARANAVRSLDEVVARNVDHLPEKLRPAGPAAIAADIAATIQTAPPPARRGLATPAIETESITRLVRSVRGLTAAGAIGSCTIAVAEEHLHRAAELLERALAEGDDVELDLVLRGSPEAAARPDDLVLA